MLSNCVTKQSDNRPAACVCNYDGGGEVTLALAVHDTNTHSVVKKQVAVTISSVGRVGSSTSSTTSPRNNVAPSNISLHGNTKEGRGGKKCNILPSNAGSQCV